MEQIFHKCCSKVRLVTKYCKFNWQLFPAKNMTDLLAVSGRNHLQVEMVFALQFHVKHLNLISIVGKWLCHWNSQNISIFHFSTGPGSDLSGTPLSMFQLSKLHPNCKGSKFYNCKTNESFRLNFYLQNWCQPPAKCNFNFSFQKISVHLNLENFQKNKEVFDTKEDVYGLLLGGETNSTFLKINLNSLRNAEMHNAKDVQQTSRAHQRKLLLLSSVSTHRDRKLWI